MQLLEPALYLLSKN